MIMESGTTRWWEYYLPRYLMPSIAGVAIVNWLCSYAGDGLRNLLLLPLSAKELDSSSLILLFLYGNLFCYVASYPVLVFHATRVMDFSKGKWPAHVFADGYLVSIALGIALFAFRFAPANYRYWLAFVAAAIFMLVQLGRLWVVSSRPFNVKGHGDRVSYAYYYSYVLCRRRGIPVLEETTKTQPRNAGERHDDLLHTPDSKNEEELEEDEEITTTLSHTNQWRREFMDTYVVHPARTGHGS